VTKPAGFFEDLENLGKPPYVGQLTTINMQLNRSKAENSIAMSHSDSPQLEQSTVVMCTGPAAFKPHGCAAWSPHLLAA
jgi:hypothetical protein